jgi:hypothetical protein
MAVQQPATAPKAQDTVPDIRETLKGIVADMLDDAEKSAVKNRQANQEYIALLDSASQELEVVTNSAGLVQFLTKHKALFYTDKNTAEIVQISDDKQRTWHTEQLARFEADISSAQQVGNFDTFKSEFSTKIENTKEYVGNQQGGGLSGLLNGLVQGLVDDTNGWKSVATVIGANMLASKNPLLGGIISIALPAVFEKVAAIKAKNAAEAESPAVAAQGVPPGGSAGVGDGHDKAPVVGASVNTGNSASPAVAEEVGAKKAAAEQAAA